MNDFFRIIFARNSNTNYFDLISRIFQLYYKQANCEQSSESSKIWIIDSGFHGLCVFSLFELCCLSTACQFESNYMSFEFEFVQRAFGRWHRATRMLKCQQISSSIVQNHIQNIFFDSQHNFIFMFWFGISNKKRTNQFDLKTSEIALY